MRSADNGLEIELKFQVPAHRRAALTRALATRTAEQVELRARYFDTDDGRLAAAQLALRLRLEGDRWVQTLKGRGDGLLQRLEHEVVCDEPATASADPPALDLSLHAGSAAGELLARVLAAEPVQAPGVRYGTEILRLKRVVRHAGAVVELALDVGDVVAGTARSPVCELEMELVAGPVTALLDLAARWADRYALVLDPATKSERAQWLVQGIEHRPVARARPGHRRAGATSERAATAVGAVLAHALPNAAAITDGAHTSAHVRQLHAAMQALSAWQSIWGPRPGQAADGVAETSARTDDPPGAADAMALLDIVRRTPSGSALARALKSPSATRGWLAWMGVMVA